MLTETDITHTNDRRAFAMYKDSSIVESMPIESSVESGSSQSMAESRTLVDKANKLLKSNRELHKQLSFATKSHLHANCTYNQPMYNLFEYSAQREHVKTHNSCMS